MCKIIKIKYVSPDGRRRTTERETLCFRSDGINPCLYQEVEEMTELVSSGTPSLVGDEISTPASASIPGTPLTATANYRYREPFDDAGEPSSSKSKGKRKSFGLYLDLGGKGKKSASPTSPTGRRKSDRSPHSDSSHGDADSIIAIEEDGHISPISPTRTSRFSLGPPLSMRRPRQPPPVVSQPQPPSSPLSMRTPTPAPFHRRNLTEPDATVRFDVDTEVTDRANAREALRRENRERARREDEARSRLEARRQRKQEADDRKLAEDLDAKERRDRAEDEYSRREYERLQEKDKKRRQQRAEGTAFEQKEKATHEEIEELEREIRTMREYEERKRQARKEQERSQEAQRMAKRLRDEESRIEHRLQEDLAKISRQREASTAVQLAEIEHEMARLEAELVKTQERRQARVRGEQLEQELRNYHILEDDIREMEGEKEREEQLRRIEQQMRYDRSAFDRQRYVPPPVPMPPLPPQQTQILQQASPRLTSPYEDEDYRRIVGQRVVQQERDMASARDATTGLQRTIAAAPPGSGMGRRNTVGGRDREREKVYRDVRKRYPQ
jgi:hypothetical protein